MGRSKDNPQPTSEMQAFLLGSHIAHCAASKRTEFLGIFRGIEIRKPVSQLVRSIGAIGFGCDASLLTNLSKLCRLERELQVSALKLTATCRAANIVDLWKSISGPADSHNLLNTSVVVPKTGL